MLKNNTIVFTDRALTENLHTDGWKDGVTARGDGDETEDTLSVQMYDGPSGEDDVDAAVQGLEHLPPPNAYVGKRNFIHQLMDVALMMANVSQLKALLVSQNNDYFYLLLTFICLSIGLQVVFTICMLTIWSIEKKLEDDHNSELPKGPCPQMERMQTVACWMDRVGSILVLFIIVSNVFIAGFGVETRTYKDSYAGPQQISEHSYTTYDDTVVSR